MKFETERLLLRPWEDADAQSCYQYASDPRVGPIAGWPVHTSVENSREIIRDVLSAPETYAICLKQDNKAIGSIGLMVGDQSNLQLTDDEAEIGYWIGVPFWGQGLIPEAVECLIQYSFETLGIKQLWCGYFDGNEKSRRVQEKCWFQYQYTNQDVEWKLMNDIRTEHITCLTKERWIQRTKLSRILGSVYSMTYSLYPIEMTPERTALVQKALAMTTKNPSEQELEQLLFDMRQSKYDLHPGCQCLIGNGYYPEEFTDGLRKLNRADEDGQAARELFAVLQKPNPDWDATVFYRAIRATYNTEYHAERIRQILAELLESAHNS